MALRVLLVLVALMTFYGCGQSSPAPEQGEKEAVGGNKPERTKAPADEEASVPANVPAYTLTKDEEGALRGLRLREVAASTDATSAEELEAITRELWAKGAEVDAMVVTFYPNEPMADPSGTGQAFLSEEAARVFISAQYADPSEADVEGQVQRAMSNGGFLIASFEEELDEMNQQVCEEWDVTTMGTPPPDMNCPGY